MTMTPWNLPHGQWSKKLAMTMTPSILSMVKLTNFDHLTTVILELWSWSKMAIFDHLTTAFLKFWPWSWSKIFDHLTMTPGRRPNGQKIVVILPPPPPPPLILTLCKLVFATSYSEIETWFVMNLINQVGLRFVVESRYPVINFLLNIRL